MIIKNNYHITRFFFLGGGLWGSKRKEKLGTRMQFAFWISPWLGAREHDQTPYVWNLAFAAVGVGAMQLVSFWGFVKCFFGCNASSVVDL